jgi:L-ribulokinase
MRRQKYTIGIDFGTLSGRAVVVRVDDGEELGSAAHDYEHGVLTRALPVGDVRLPTEWALQVPEDYRQVLKRAVPEAVRRAGIDPGDVIGIGTDFTACTMVPVLSDGTPLSETTAFADRPHAYAKLWRHHSAQPQADRINALASDRKEPWLKRYGGFVSSEWEFAKALQILEEDAEVYRAVDRWVEAADWIVWQLCGTYVRNACSAGYKGILQDGRAASSTAASSQATGATRRANPASGTSSRGSSTTACRRPSTNRRGLATSRYTTCSPNRQQTSASVSTASWHSIGTAAIGRYSSTTSCRG